MKKVILTMAALLTMSSVSAQTVDLSLYKDSCVKSYEHSIYRNGTSGLNGVFLKYKGDRNINDNFSSLYFSPDYNLDVMFNENELNKKRTYNLVKDGRSYVFYDHKLKYDGDRTGMKFEIDKTSYNTYELKVSITTYNRLGKGNILIPVYDKDLDFRANTDGFGKPLLVLNLERDFDKEKSLYTRHTELSLACRK